MAKWQAIANVTNQVKDEAKNYLVYKLQKDASVELPNLWGSFIDETTKHLHDSQSHIEVLPNSKTGGLTTTLKFDELHPDFADNDKPFSNYALEKYDKRGTALIESVKNPITRKNLQAKIGNYRVDFLNNINHTDIKLVEGKRHNLAIESIEKLKNTAYSHPELYQSHLEDCFNSINSLSLLPLEKEQLTAQAQSELAGATASGMLKNSPDSLINISKLPPESQPLWIQHLSLEQRIKLDNQIKHLQEHRQVMRQHEIGNLIKSNKESILETGESIKGIDNLVIAAFGGNSRQFQQFKEEENFYRQAFSVTDQIKHISFEDGAKLLETLKPIGGDPDFYYKQQIYNIASKFYGEQLREATNDPAKFAESIYTNEKPQDLSFAERLQKRKILQEQSGIPSYAQRYLTNNEHAEFIRKIEDSTDVNEIKNTIDGIIALRSDQGNNYGLEIMQELVQGRDSELLTSFYAEHALHGNTKLANIFLKMIPFKGQLFNKGEENLINKEIAKNPVIKKWQRGFYNSDIQNIEEINRTKEQIKYLALHYTKSGELDFEKAVKKATNEIIENRYMSVAGDRLQLPKEIIDNNKIHYLSQDYIDAALSELRGKIINRDIDYDYYTSFGIADTNAIPNEQELQKLREIISNGKWKLTPDKKSVYFTYQTKDGADLPLMQSEKNILKFDLVDLNNPDALEDQKQRLEEMASSIFFYGSVAHVQQ